MGYKTGISWCDHTASPWHGCTHGVYTDADGNEHEHPGCGHCYAEAMAKRNPGTLGVWGKDGTRVRSASFHANCRRWNKQAERDGVIRSVFPSICDPFEMWEGPILERHGERLYKGPPGTPWENDVGIAAFGPDSPAAAYPLTMDDLRRELFQTIDACQWLRFLLLTKRPGNVKSMWLGTPGRRLPGRVLDYRPNVWLITSVSDQPTADALIPPLLECRDLAPVMGVSCEPLLGPINLITPGYLVDCPETAEYNLARYGLSQPLSWVISGAESGPRRREFQQEWDVSLQEQCAAAGVAFYRKQIIVNGRVSTDPEEWPARLRVREFPEVQHG